MTADPLSAPSVHEPETLGQDPASSDAPDGMRVLIAAGVPRRREGGVASVIYHLGGELERLGNHVSYLFFEDLLAPRECSERFAELIFSFRVARYAVKNRANFSVVNLHAPAGLFYGLYRRLRGRADLPPYVMTLHGLEERRVQVMRREAKKGRAWHFAWTNRAWHRLYHHPRFRWSIRTADGAHVCARDVWNQLVLKYKLNDDRVRYIPHGVDARFFRCRDYRLAGKPRLLYVGTWLDQRGIFYLRNALRNLAARKQEFVMTFVGAGAPAREILNFFGEELASRVHVREAVPQEQIQDLYAEHDIFVFPSLLEGLPCVLLEAMAGGMPVITTETCGMPDVVENEFNGLLIPPADAAALEEAIVRLVNSEELRGRLGQAAREYMRRYTWERAGGSLHEFLRRIVARDGGHHKESRS
jgi:glycosyltransferase involved in cell wall biosynthesis